MSKIEIKYELKQGHRNIYSCKWSINKEKTILVQSIERGVVDSFRPTFFNGDNIRLVEGLNEEEYYIKSYEISNTMTEVVFIYILVKGRYVVPEWLVIAVIES